MVELASIAKQAKGFGERLRRELTPANALSLSRPFLVAGANRVGLEKPGMYRAFMIAAQVTDIFDGIAARKYGPSPYGGLIDIVSDHATEAVLYRGLKQEGIVPSWVPVITAARHVTTDLLRAGHTIFDSAVLHERNGILQLNGSETAKKVVGSRVMRGGFGALKAVVPFVAPSHPRLARDLSVVAAGVSVARGIPVVFNRENITLMKHIKQKHFRAR